MDIKKFRRVEITYIRGWDEIYICPYAAISIIPRIGETIWISGRLREDLIERHLPTVYKVEDVCYHVSEMFGDMESYDSIVIYVGDLR